MGEFGQRVAAGVTVLGTVAGFALIVTGLVQLANAPNASNDFKVLDSPCVIVGVYYGGTETMTSHNHATKKTDYSCLDLYTYEFAWCQDGTTCPPSTAPSALGSTAPRAGFTPSWSSTVTEVAVYRDWWTSFPPPDGAAFANSGWEAGLLVSAVDRVCRFGKCASSPQSNSTHDAGEWVRCYQPSSTPVDSTYECGNPSCIKVLDPAGAINHAPMYDVLYFGIGVFVFFGLLWICFYRSQENRSCGKFFRFVLRGDD